MMSSFRNGVGAAVAALILACSSTTTSPGGDDGGRPRDSGVGDTYTQVDGSPVTDRDAQDKDDGGSCTDANQISFGPPACNSCMDAHCCPAIDACFQNADCSDLSDCIDTCGNADAGADAGASCRADCRSKHAGSLAKYDAVVSCQTSNCSLNCK
jgi:hypothetical protein